MIHILYQATKVLGITPSVWYRKMDQINDAIVMHTDAISEKWCKAECEKKIF